MFNLYFQLKLILEPVCYFERIQTDRNNKNNDKKPRQKSFALAGFVKINTTCLAHTL